MFSLSISFVILSCLLAGRASAQASFPDCSQAPLSSIDVCDTSKDPVTRAKALAEALTVSEIVANSGNEAAGVPRLDLPPYEWWSEALVSRLRPEEMILTHPFATAWCCE